MSDEQKSSVWNELHKNYAGTDWIERSNIFAGQVLKFLPKGGKLLDIGCGQGQDSRYFVENGFEVTGIDLSDKALQVAKRKDPAAQFMQMDISKGLDFSDKSFDVVYAHLSLHYFDAETTQKIFTEISRVLKPGGILAFFTNSTSDPEFGQGDKLEDGLYFIEGKSKRFLDVDMARNFTQTHFTEILLDNKGETYKDAQKGIHNLIRYIGKKRDEL